jgi:hypothetical protein
MVSHPHSTGTCQAVHQHAYASCGDAAACKLAVQAFHDPDAAAAATAVCAASGCALAACFGEAAAAQQHLRNVHCCGSAMRQCSKS